MTAETIMDGGSAEQKRALLPSIAEGRSRAALAVWEPDYRYNSQGIALSATPMGMDFLLNGTKLFVLDAHTSQVMIVAARTRKTQNPGEGITLFLVETDNPAVSIRLHNTMDGGRKQCEVAFNHLQIPASKILGPVDHGWEILAQTLKKGAVALSLECVGGGQRVLDMAVDYAKIRVQFGRPIGSFQAIKHKCAQMMLEVEGARSIAYYAAWAIDQGGKEADIAASAAKSYCSEMYKKAVKDAVQIFGAIGMTWEHEMHLFVKRAKMNEFAFGDPSYHKEHLARIFEY
jgi:alkylation response protein AidB-like acyl-CoA dehydrogenase